MTQGIEKRKIIENSIIMLLFVFLSAFLWKFYSKSVLIIVALILVMLMLVIDVIKKDFINNLLTNVIKYRYLIALISFILLVTFNVNGSSNNEYINYLGLDDSYGDTMVLGEARALRSDEYKVQLPYYFSQYYNNYNQISNQMSMSGQDMIIGYNAPVKDITMLAKPFTIGYVIFGNSIGLSWYWCSKVILMLLVSFELCKIITKNDKLSLVGMLLLTFAPAMQWWFSPHMYDVFFWCTTLIVVGYHFFVQTKKKYKILFTILAILSLTGFVLALFPSLQIGVGLVSIGILVSLLYRDRDKIEFNKWIIIRILLVILGIGIMFIPFILNGGLDAVKLLNNTAYPGHRVSLGGDFSFNILFTDITNFLTPYKELTYMNNCEMSSFIHFGVFFLLYYPYIYYKNKKIHNSESLALGNFLFVSLIIEIIFMLVGFPEFLSKITLFSYINRMNLVYGFTAFISSIYLVNLLIRNKDFINLKYGLCATIIFGGLYYVSIDNNQISYFQSVVDTFVSSNSTFATIIAIGLISIFILMLVSVLLNKHKYFYVLCVLSIIVSGFTINPIVIGNNAVDNTELAKEVQKISTKNNGLWIAATNDTFSGNYLLANGAKVFGATNFYPDYGKWKIIDKDKKYDDCYNRYANMKVALVDEKTNMNNPHSDVVNVNLNYNDLKSLNISYIYINRDISSDLIKYDIKSKIIYNNSQNSTYIIELKY
ncbi:MAG: hypothetical protein PHH04_00435 [Thomasclavelia sp.]|nr:hypothetical protein [Thomasclavelia sp.]